MTLHRLSAHGSRWTLDARGNQVIDHAIKKTRKPYEPGLLEAIFDHGFTGLAVDVGASVGNHSIYLARVCDLRVIAFEPLLNEQLRANVERNRLRDSIRIVPVALSDASGRATHVGPHGKLRLARGGEVQTTLLDAFVETLGELTLIKIDVEGMELLVLRGAHKTLERYRPVVLAEQADDAAHDLIRRELEPLGYRLTRVFDHRDAVFTPVGWWDPT